jgi:hypothetical protein
MKSKEKNIKHINYMYVDPDGKKTGENKQPMSYAQILATFKEGKLVASKIPYDVALGSFKRVKSSNVLTFSKSLALTIFFLAQILATFKEGKLVATNIQPGFFALDKKKMVKAKDLEKVKAKMAEEISFSSSESLPNIET